MHKFKHPDLLEIESKYELSQTRRQTQPSHMNMVARFMAIMLVETWKDGWRALRMSDIDAEWDRQGGAAGFKPLFIQGLKKLERIGQVKIDVDREGGLFSPGKNWIETEVRA